MLLVLVLMLFILTNSYSTKINKKVIDEIKTRKGVQKGDIHDR